MCFTNLLCVEISELFHFIKIMGIWRDQFPSIHKHMLPIYQVNKLEWSNIHMFMRYNG